MPTNQFPKYIRKIEAKKGGQQTQQLEGYVKLKIEKNMQEQIHRAVRTYLKNKSLRFTHTQ